MLCTGKKRVHYQLKWRSFSVHSASRASGETNVSEFDLTNNSYPDLYFSRVKSYALSSNKPLQLVWMWWLMVKNMGIRRWERRHVQFRFTHMERPSERIVFGILSFMVKSFCDMQNCGIFMTGKKSRYIGAPRRKSPPALMACSIWGIEIVSKKLLNIWRLYFKTHAF